MTSERVLGGLDLDTYQKGVEPPFETWESDHTALVHVLWGAKSLGLINPPANDATCDQLASMIMHSRWLAAQRHQAASAPGGRA